jgi:hypothetical protein
MTKIAGSGSKSGSGSISQRHGSANPDPHQNVMDPEHWLRNSYFLDSATVGKTHPICPVGEAGQGSLLLHPVQIPVPVNLPEHAAYNDLYEKKRSHPSSLTFASKCKNR